MTELRKPIYLDYAATTPVDPEVADLMRHYMVDEFGNAGSRTHEYGTRAKQAVQKARQQIATIAGCQPDEVIFTSGATESNNLAILGLRKHGEETGKKHIISTAIEHKAVLEPLEHLRDECGFEVDFIRPGLSGAIEAQQVEELLREETLMVSVMHVNNETGIIQPIEEVAEILKGTETFFHVDAAQSFAKLVEPLQNPRIDMFSLSGHKIGGPKGVGALITRRRKYRRLPLRPLSFGGGQEFGLRPGTLPVHLLVGLAKAAELSTANYAKRTTALNEYQCHLLGQLSPFGFKAIGDAQLRIGTILCCASPNSDSEASILRFKGSCAISNGSACTSSNYSSSHVLLAMGLTGELINGAIRFSFSALGEIVELDLPDKF
ncbi:MAG: aminotransferase class V-fold PLP-dependent enzyme [Coraliomargaritaceae bacterium]